MKDKILEILKSNVMDIWVKEDLTGADHPSITFKGHNELIGLDKSASEIESLIKENYLEKEFAEWFRLETGGQRYLQIDDEPKKYITRVGAVYKTLDEVYQYWQTNIRDK